MGNRPVQDSAEEWAVVGTRTSFHGKVWDITTDEVVMPDGKVSARDYQQHTGAVGVLALNEAGEALLVRQYRHPVRQKLWELPAGLLDVPGENPLKAAQRELYEEAHRQAEDWRVLVDLYPSAGGSSEAIRVFLARSVSEVAGDRFEAEGEELDLELRWVPLDEIVQLILDGELHNAAMITAVLAAKAALTGKGLDALRPAEAPWPARPFE